MAGVTCDHAGAADQQRRVVGADPHSRRDSRSSRSRSWGSAFSASSQCGAVAPPVRAENHVPASGNAVVLYGPARPSSSRAGAACWALHCCPRCGSTRTRFAGLPGSSPDDPLSGADALHTAATRESGVSRMFVESEDDEQSSRGSRRWTLARPRSCVVSGCRHPAGGERRVQEVSTHSTMVPSLCELANRLVELGVTRVVMEACRCPR